MKMMIKWNYLEQRATTELAKEERLGMRWLEVSSFGGSASDEFLLARLNRDFHVLCWLRMKLSSVPNLFLFSVISGIAVFKFTDFQVFLLSGCDMWFCCSSVSARSQVSSLWGNRDSRLLRGWGFPSDDVVSHADGQKRRNWNGVVLAQEQVSFFKSINIFKRRSPNTTWMP